MILILKLLSCKIILYILITLLLAFLETFVFYAFNDLNDCKNNIFNGHQHVLLTLKILL